MIMYFEIIFLIILGLLSSFTDIKKGLIYEKHTFGITFIGIISHLIYGIYLGDYLLALSGLIGGLIGFVVGAALFYTGIWAGGDAKLLMAYGSVIPNLKLSYSSALYTGPVSVLLNTILLISPFLIIYALTNSLSGYKEVSKLDTGDIPGVFIIKKKDDIEVYEPSLWEMIKQVSKENAIIKPMSTGLNEEKIADLKQYNENGELSDEIKVMKSMKFAPFLFLGSLTLAFYGDLFWKLVFGI